ncbi:MAG: hypothetical protein IKU42_00205, partial [Oscillospiraceae bacterium]|nr:hypothetical protein [Oscillospiraceae bacterium]
YKEKGESDYNTIYPINTRCEAEGVICGSSQTYAVEWEIIDKTKISDSKPEYITEYLTIDFDPGIVFAEILWEPITDLSRITYYRQNEDPLDESVLINGGLTMSLSNGKFHAGFDITREFDVYNVPNAMISIAPPNDGVEYVAFKINESGGGSKNYYDPWKPVDQDVVIQGGDFFDITDWRTRCLNIAYFRCENIDGIDVWYTGNAGGEQTMIIDWYTSTDENAKPAKREFIYVKYEDYLNKATTSSVTKEELKENYGTGVTEATPIGKNWKLNVNHYPQSKYNDEYAYYFQLEATGEVPEGKKIIYIPYSYIDEDLDYEKALELKLHPKLKHYDDSHNKKENIDGVLTPYGMMFVVSDFSPFIIEAVASTANVASIGETAYGSLKAALAAAKSGDTIKLISDTNEETVTINDEITLDLNGYKLTAGSFISIGKIVDNSKAKTGILNVLENVVFNYGNGQMPLLTEEGYVFANIRHQTFVVDSATTATTFALDVRPAFGTKFTQYLSDNGGTDNKISIVINLKWDGGSMDFRFSDELTAKVYAQSGKTMRINVSGVTEEIGKVIATVKVLSDTGVVIESKEYVFPDHFTK